MTARWHDGLDRQVATRPDAPALTDSIGTSWDYAALDAACEDLRGVLEKAGLRPGDRAMILIENCAAAVAGFFACSRMGVRVVPVNARQTEAELTRVLEHARPAAVLATSAVSPDAAAHIARLGGRPVTGAFGTLDLATPYPSDPDSDPEVAALLYTTGTTGTPKGVMLTHANLVYGGSRSAELRRMTPDDLIYGVLPITHVFGLSSVVTAAIWAGTPVRFEARFSAARVYAALQEGVTLFAGVPQMHALVMQYTRDQGYSHVPGSRLRYCSSGAAPLDPAWKRKAEAFYGTALQNGWGMTETTSGAALTDNVIGDPDTSVGRPFPGVEIAIDTSVPGGGDGTGEVITRGPNVMKGYYKNPDETARVLSPDGWLRTGDLGRIDAEGRLHIMGRTKELIIHGGFNVYPPEVEEALNDHPQVIHSAVVGRSVGGDEEVLAFVQAAPGDLPDEDELRAFAAARLAGYKRPARIIVATELPAAPTGKILKHKLLAHFADRLGD